MAEQLPIWQDPGVEPPALLKTNGWQPGMKPSAQHMNWLFNRIYKCLEEIQAGGGTEELEQELADLQLDFAEHLIEKASINKVGHVQLSNLINGTSETKAVTEKAVSDAIANVKAWGQNAVNAGATNADPNTTQESYILTDHVNSPGGGVFWHIQTYFYANRLGNKGQIAISYNGNTSQMYTRHLYGDTWTAWRQVLGSDMINKGWGIAGLDGSGKMYPSVMPSGMDSYSLISTLTLSGQHTVSVEGLANYRKLKVVFKDVNFGRASVANTFAIIFNDNNSILGSVYGTRIMTTQLISDADNNRSSIWLTNVNGNTLADAIVDGIVTFEKSGVRTWNILGQTSQVRMDFKGPHQASTTLASFSGNAAVLNKMTFGITGQTFPMLSGSIEIWGAL